MARKPSPKQVVFENVFVRSASVSNGDKREGKIEFTGSFTAAIREEMNWEECPEHYGATDLFGTLAISEAMLTPNAPIAKNGDMGQHKEILPATALGGFNLVPLKDKGGEVLARELRFTLYTSQLNVPGIAGRYIAKLGRAPGTLVCTLADEDRQMGLEDAGEAKD